MSALSDPVEVFRGATRRAVEERALVLRTLELPFTVGYDRGQHSLWVPGWAAERALAELAQYEEENRDWPPVEQLPAAAPGWFQAGILYGALIVLSHVFAVQQAFGFDWYGAGVAHAEAIRNGELWRAVTALGLHTGPPHLLSNLVFGLFFGGLAAWSLGGGVGWLAILVAGLLGNVSNAWLLGIDHRSVGASTAVFGAIGLIVGTEWRRRYLLKNTFLRRFAPPLMGLLLFGFLGVGGGEAGSEQLGRTDITAHLTGLVWGVPLGVLALHVPAAVTRSRRAQLGLGLLAVALYVGAWACALA